MINFFNIIVYNNMKIVKKGTGNSKKNAYFKTLSLTLSRIC